jgi:hypothetical protein
MPFTHVQRPASHPLLRESTLLFHLLHLTPSQGFYTQHGLPRLDGKLNPKAFKPATTTPIQVHGTFQMAASSQVSKEGLVILHFLLAGMDSAGSPARLLGEYMHSYLDEESLLYQEITFDLSSDTLVKNYHQRLRSLARDIK